MTHMFKASLSAGKVGESLFSDLLIRGGIDDFKDVSDDKSFQKEGIDFVVNDIKIDVKFDIRAITSGNLAFETVSRQKDGKILKEGWTKTSTADLFVYVTFLGSNICFAALTPEDIQNLMSNHGLGERIVKNYGYESVVIPVPTSICIGVSKHYQSTIGEAYDIKSLKQFFSSLGLSKGV